MSATSRRLVRAIAALSLAALSVGCNSQRISEVTTDSVNILRTFSAANVIPPGEIAEAKAVAILRESEGAAIVGFSGGEGVLVRRLEDGWSPPLAIEASSASIGLQIGGQSREMVLVINSTGAIDRLLASGTYAIGRAEGVFGDAQGRAKPESPESQVTPFVRTDGVFGGVSINGLTIKASSKLNERAYGDSWSTRKILEGKVTPPPGTSVLWRTLDEMSVPRPPQPAQSAEPASGDAATGAEGAKSPAKSADKAGDSSKPAKGMS